MTKRALLLIDIQKDFCKGGALAVPNGDEVVPIANALITKFTNSNDEVIATQDWHPSDHKSFAINNEGKALYSVIDLNGLPQVLWPAHCVNGSDGAEFHDDLFPIPLVFCKGEDVNTDSYSGFFDNGKRNKTQLDKHLKSNFITDLFILGLATDYCVKFTAIDAVELGYNVTVVIDGCRGVNLNTNACGAAIEHLLSIGVKIVNSSDVQ